MRNIFATLFVGLTLICSSTMANFENLEKININCYLELTKEVLSVKNVDALSHYGAFALLSSKPQTKIRGHVSSVNDELWLTVVVGTGEGASDFLMISHRDSLKAGHRAVLSTWIKNPGTKQKEWLSCTLTENK